MNNVTYTFSVEAFVPVLKSLAHILDKAGEHARAAKSDPDALADARLAPDMFPLSTQVQFACHQAKEACARLSGRDAPTLAREEQMSFHAMKLLIAETIEELEGMSAKSFEGGEARKIEIALGGPLTFESDGLHFLRDWSLGHFYFHVVTAYDILRHKGVELGKRDYMSHVGPYIRGRG
jgi:uncharacterized protein